VVDTTHHCFIPNAFSPNGDGMNDQYEIPCNDEYPKASLEIFDRWGMEVWASNGHYLNNWDGRNQQGVKLPDGTYYIIYKYNDGTNKSEAKFVVIGR
jgi:gliding motility-associated-like protein